MARRRRRRSSPRRRRSTGRRAGGGSNVLTRRDQMVALVASAGYGYLGQTAAANPNGTAAEWMRKVPGRESPLGTAGVLAIGLYALGKFMRVAPRYTIPAAFGLANFAAVRAGQRGFGGAGTDVLSGNGPEDTAYLAGDFDESDFTAGDWAEAELVQ